MSNNTKVKKYNYFYKITNVINNHFYYGIHSTNNLNDGYMGSGVRLQKAYKKYGMENFSKEILKFFNSREEAANYEAEMVTETLIKDNNCYNIVLGGEKYTTMGTATVRDKDGNIMQVPVDDPRYLSGELYSIMVNRVAVKDEYGNTMVVDSKDPRYLSGEYVGCSRGKSVFLDKTGKKIYTDIDDPRVISGELVALSKNKLTVKDKYGNYYSVNNNDPRYLSGELAPLWAGRKHKEETKQKQRRTFEKINHQQGVKNSQFGTCWITKDGINKKIKREEIDIFEQDGWKKGRVCKK